MKNFFLFLMVLYSTTSFSQNNIGIGTHAPDPSAVLDLTAKDKGFLVPRLSANERTAITNPALGLLVYDLDTQCYFYFNGATMSWQNLCGVMGVCLMRPAKRAKDHGDTLSIQDFILNKVNYRFSVF